MLRSLLSSTTRNGRGSTPAKRDVSAPSSTTRCGQSSTWARRPYPGWPRNRSSTTCTCSATALRRSSACCSSATGYAKTMPTATTTNAPSGSWPAATGGTFSTTPTPRPRWSRRSWSAPRPRRERPDKQSRGGASRVGGVDGPADAMRGEEVQELGRVVPLGGGEDSRAGRVRDESVGGLDGDDRGGPVRVPAVHHTASAVAVHASGLDDDGEPLGEAAVLGRPVRQAVDDVGGDGGTQPGAQLSLGEALDAAGAYMARNHDDLGQRELHDRGRLGVAGKGDCRASCRRSSAPVAVLPDEAAVLEGLHGFEHGAQGAAGGPAAIYGVRGGDLGDGLDQFGENVRDQIAGDRAVGCGGDDGDPGPVRVCRESVENLLDVELLPGGVEVVTAGRDRGVDHGVARRRERPRAVDDRLAPTERGGQGAVVVPTGDASFRVKDFQPRRGLAEAGGVAADQNRPDAPPGQLGDDEAALVAACAVDRDPHEFSRSG